MQNDGFGFQGFPWVLFCLKAAQFTSAIQNVHFPPERAPSIGLRLPRIQLNDVTCHVFSRTTCSTWSKRIIVLHGANECHIRDDSPDLWVHRRFPCNTTYIIQLESRLCRFDVAPVRFLRSNELFRHHTPSSRSWK